VGMKTVLVQPMDKDRYGRLVAVVYLQGSGQSLNLELVKAGLAWWYRRYAPGDRPLEEAEEEARAARRGLWKDPAPIPPWEWRSGQRTARRMAVNPSADPAAAYHGNIGSRIFHRPGCRW